MPVSASPLPRTHDMVGVCVAMRMVSRTQDKQLWELGLLILVDVVQSSDAV